MAIQIDGPAIRKRLIPDIELVAVREGISTEFHIDEVRKLSDKTISIKDNCVEGGFYLIIKIPYHEFLRHLLDCNPFVANPFVANDRQQNVTFSFKASHREIAFEPKI